MFKLFKQNKCEHTRKLLSEYIDEQLNPREAALIAEHLAGCDECREECESLRKTVGFLAQVKSVPVPHSFVLTAVRPVPYPSFFRPLRIASAVLAVMLALVFTGDVTNILPGMFPNEAVSSQKPAISATSTSVPPEGDVVTQVSDSIANDTIGTGEVLPPSKVGEEGPAPQGVQEDAKLPSSSSPDLTNNDTPSPASTNVTEELWWLRTLELVLLCVFAIAMGTTLYIWRRCKRISL